MSGSAVAAVTRDNEGIGLKIVRAQRRQLLGDAVACAGHSQAAVARLWEGRLNLLPDQLDINSVDGLWGTF